MAEPSPLDRLNRYADRNGSDYGPHDRGCVDALRKALTTNPTARGTALREIIRAAYPFGQRKHAPYKAWRRVVREALGIEELRRRRERDARDAASALFTEGL